MKCRIIFIFAVVALLLATFDLGCSSKDDQGTSEDANTTVPVTETDEKEPTTALIRPGIGVGKVQFGMAVDDMKEILGKPDIDATGISYVYADLGIEVVFRDDKVHSIYCVHHMKGVPDFRVCKYRTQEGIGIDSSESDIITAYGEPAKRSDGALMYKELGLRFELENGQVRKIIALKPW